MKRMRNEKWVSDPNAEVTLLDGISFGQHLVLFLTMVFELVSETPFCLR